VNAHVETLRAIRSAFDNIHAPCAERDAVDAAIAALEAQGEAVHETQDAAPVGCEAHFVSVPGCYRCDRRLGEQFAPPSSPAMRALVAKWRADAERIEPKGKIGYVTEHSLGLASAYEACADELEDALAHPEVKKLMGEGK